MIQERERGNFYKNRKNTSHQSHFIRNIWFLGNKTEAIRWLGVRVAVLRRSRVTDSFQSTPYINHSVPTVSVQFHCYILKLEMRGSADSVQIQNFSLRIVNRRNETLRAVLLEENNQPWWWDLKLNSSVLFLSHHSNLHTVTRVFNKEQQSSFLSISSYN